MDLKNLKKEEQIKYLNDLRKHHSYVLEQDYEVTDIYEDGCEMTFTSSANRHANLRGDVHGGVYASLADSTMGTSCFLKGKGVVTLDLSGNYLKGIKAGETFVCRAKVEHNGRRTMVTTCEILNDKGQVCYIGHGTFFVVELLENYITRK